MSKSIRANLELVSVPEVEKIERLDASDISSQPDKYVKANLLGYYVLINSWLMLVQQWSQYGWVYMLNYIKSHGLFDLIRGFDNAASEFIAGIPMTFSLARTLWNDVARARVYNVPIDPDLEVFEDPRAAMLLILRYGKRFSPLETDLLRETAIQNFISEQRRLRIVQSQEPSRFVISYVKEAASNLLDWRSLVKNISSISYDDMIFTPGVTFDTKADLVSKLRRVAQERVEYFPQPFGIPMVMQPLDAKTVGYWGKNGTDEVHLVRLSPVPKNYKTARVIAPEDVVRQALARRCFVICDDYLPDLIKLHDQSQNQILACEGSVTRDLATLDLHAASDSITISTLYNILPHDFVDQIKRYLPTHYVWKDKVRLLQSAATMGNSLTFWLESVVFCSVAVAAVKYYNLMAGTDYDVVSVYGDDIIVPTDTALLVIEWLEELGFVVNHDKSFFSRDTGYRESCGVEYLDGHNLTTRYFPRFPLVGTLGKASDRYVRDSLTNEWTTTLTSLIDLQHKLYKLCVPAALFTAEVIKEMEPRMTTSTPDEGFQDIWSYESTPKVLIAPHLRGTFKDVATTPDYALRQAHLGPAYLLPHYREECKTPGEALDQRLLDLYNYQRFLKEGPRYDTPLDKLLGVSSPLTTLEEASRLGEVKWVFIK